MTTPHDLPNLHDFDGQTWARLLLTAFPDLDTCAGGAACRCSYHRWQTAKDTIETMPLDNITGTIAMLRGMIPTVDQAVLSELIEALNLIEAEQ